MPRSATAMVLAATAVLAGCGASTPTSDGGTADSAAPAVTSPAATTLTADAGPADSVTVDTEPGDPTTVDPAAADPAADSVPPESADGAAAVEEPSAPPTTEPSPPTTTIAAAELGGRAFAEAVEVTSEIPTNALPDLVVDDVGRNTPVNLRNVFPADRPVLFWLWAPH